MKRQVTVIIQHSGVNALGLFQKCAREYQPHRNRHAGIKKKIEESPAIGPRAGSVYSLDRPIEIGIRLRAAFFIDEQQKRRGQNDRGQRNRKGSESQNHGEDESDQTQSAKAYAGSAAQTRSERRALVVDVSEKRAARDGDER